MGMHNVKTEQLSADALKAHVAERVAVVEARPGDEAEHKAKVKYERDRFKDGGFNLTCDCGWTANNPLPSQEAVDEAIAEHYAHVQRAMGVAGLGG